MVSGHGPGRGLSSQLPRMGSMWKYPWGDDGWKKLYPFDVSEESNAVEGRHLGLLERWYTGHQQYQRNFTLVQRWAVEAGVRQPSLGEVYAAAAVVVEKHFALRSMLARPQPGREETWIHRKQGLPRRIPLGRCSAIHSVEDLEEALGDDSCTAMVRWKQREDESTWTTVAHEGSHERFDIHGGDCMRVTLVSNGEASLEECRAFHVVFAFHHLVADGLSGAVIVDEFSRILSAIGRESLHEEGDSLLQVIESIPLDTHRIPVEAAVDCRPSVLAFIGELQKIIVAKLYSVINAVNPFAPRDAALLPNVVLPISRDTADWDASRTSKATRRTLSDGELSQLYRRCKAEGCSVNAVLVAASCFAIVLVNEKLEKSTGKPARDSWKVSGSFPVALRRASQGRLAENAVGVFLTAVTVEELCQGSTSLWNLARTVKGETERLTPHVIEMVGMLQFIPNIKLLLDTQRSSTTAGRECSFNTSNLGRLRSLSDHEKCRGWQPTDVYFSQQVHAGVGGGVSLGALTYNGRLQLAWNAAQPIMPPEVPALQAEFVTQVLFRAMEESSSGITLSDFLPVT